jgi:RNA polymerase sigma factor (sigma-70 family)
MDDRTLLRSYALNRDQAAFSELVRRHADLVYSAARRQVGDHHRAQEVTQSVFLALARKAGSLAEHPVLAAWLFQSTRLSSAKLREADVRRVVREDYAVRDAGAVAEIDESAGGGEWERIAPCLDEALAGLREKDRAAVVLRFFQQRSFAEVGAALGMGENAARMRTERALEKLRAAMVRRGVRSTAEALGVALGVHGVMAAPAGTGISVIAATVAAGGGATLGSGFALLFMGKIKIGAVAVAAAGLASLATYLSLRPQSPVPASGPSNIRTPAEVVARPPVNARDHRAAGLERDNADLQARLAEAAAELEKRTTELEGANRKLAELRRPLAPGKTQLLSSALKASTRPGEVIVTGGSRLADGKRMFAFIDPRPMPLTNRKGTQVEVKAELIALPEEFVKELGLDHLLTGAANTLQHGEVWSADEVARVMERLEKNGSLGADILSAPKITLLAGGAGEVNVGEENENGEYRGVRVGVSSEVSAADGTLATEVRVELAEDRAE